VVLTGFKLVLGSIERGGGNDTGRHGAIRVRNITVITLIFQKKKIDLLFAACLLVTPAEVGPTMHRHIWLAASYQTNQTTHPLTIYPLSYTVAYFCGELPLQYIFFLILQIYFSMVTPIILCCFINTVMLLENRNTIMALLWNNTTHDKKWQWIMALRKGVGKYHNVIFMELCLTVLRPIPLFSFMER
jgi:hypothetical protein